MIDKRLRSEITQCELSYSSAGPLHFDSSIIRYIKSGSPCSLHCLGRSYKLRRGYPPSPHDDVRGPHLYPQGVCRFESHTLATLGYRLLSAGRKPNLPFSEWRGVFLIIRSFVV